jgi:hypothetical protein
VESDKRGRHIQRPTVRLNFVFWAGGRNGAGYDPLRVSTDSS